MTDDFEHDITKSTIKIENIKDVVDKRFKSFEKRKDIKNVVNFEQQFPFDISNLPEEIKSDPQKYIEIIQILTKYEKLKKDKPDDVMFQ